MPRRLRLLAVIQQHLGVVAGRANSISVSAVCTELHPTGKILGRCDFDMSFDAAGSTATLSVEKQKGRW
jgi:hypothetical protein